MNVQLMNVTTAVIAFPSDGNGARTTEFVVPKVSTAAGVFTATGGTATWGTANSAPNATGGGTSATVAGDYVTTSDGCWGAVVSGNATSVVVDKWRCVGQVSAGSVPVVPLAGSTIHIYSGKCQLTGSRRPRILRIIFTKQGDTNTCIITNAVGTTVYTHTLAGTVPSILDFTGSEEGGLRTDGPFGITLSNTATACVVEYVP